AALRAILSVRKIRCTCLLQIHSVRRHLACSLESRIHGHAGSVRTVFRSETFQTRVSIAKRTRVREWLPGPPKFQRPARNCDGAEARVLQPASLARELKPARAGPCNASHRRRSEL